MKLNLIKKLGIKIQIYVGLGGYHRKGNGIQLALTQLCTTIWLGPTKLTQLSTMCGGFTKM